MFKNYADVDTFATQEDWTKMSESKRLDLIKQKISEHNEFEVIHPTRSQEDGQVFIELTEELPASKRGIMLLSFEALLKENIDQGINVWHEPIDDKNKLRKLRGIEIKS